MANIPLDDLQIDIVVNASKAQTAITKLANSLSRLEDFHPDTHNIKTFLEELSEVADTSVRINALAESLKNLQKALSKFQMPKGLASTMQENIKGSMSAEDALMRVPSTKDVSAMAASFKNIAAQIKILDEVGRSAFGFYAVVDKIGELASYATQLKGVASSISKVSAAVGRAGGSRRGGTSSTGSLGDGTADGRTDTEGAGDRIQDTGDKTEDSGRKAEKAAGGFGKLFASFKRIAMYRALRSAIRAITSAFGEGIENLVKWDAAFGNNSSGALATMTELKSLALQVKNSLGAMAMPIIQVFLPVLRAAAKALMFIANLINQVVRAFQGETDYMKAVYTEVDYLGDSLGRASGKAKELKRVLFGFDELNVLPSPDTYSGGAGVGVLDGINDYFRKTEISPFIKGLADDIDYWLGPWFDGNTYKSLWDDITYWLGPIFDGDTWKGIWDDIAYWAKWAWDGITGTWGKFKRKIIDPIVDAFETAWGFINAYFVKPVTGVLDAIFTTVGKVVNYITHPSGWNKEGWEQITGDLKLLWSTTFDEIGKEQDEFLAKQNIKKFEARWRAEIETLPPVGIATSFKVPTNGKNVYREGKVAVASLDPIGFGTKLSPLKNFNETQKSGQTEANKVGSIAFGTALAALTGFASVLTKGQGEINKLNPLTFLTTISTYGFGSILARVWDNAQRGLNSNPLIFSATIGTTAASELSMANARNNLTYRSFASGGVPDVGTLFYAGEAGAEVVANMNNGRTGVMNVSQMQDAVAAGNIEVVNAIYAMANMVVNAVNTKDLDVYMDSAKVGQSVTNYQNNQMRRGVAY